MKRKKKSLKKLAWEAFSRYIRLRDCINTTGSPDFGYCITCREAFPYSKLQAGHYIPGRGNAVLFDEDGVNAQCTQCNIFKHGDPITYREVLVEKFGEDFVKLMELKRHISIKMRAKDYNLIRISYEKKAEELQEALCNS